MNNGHPPDLLTDLFSIRGKTAIVTGGTGGLGFWMTSTLAEAGADIVSIQLPSDPHAQALRERIEGLGRKFSVYDCDVANSKALRETFSKIWQAGTIPDVLLNCAGIINSAPVIDMDDDAIDSVLNINLKATFVTCQEFGKKLISLGRPGKIINIGSISAFVGINTCAPYAVSKGGVMQATRTFSGEFAPKGIQVNCICPGHMKTPLTKPYYEDVNGIGGYLQMRTPAGRWGEPQDLRGAVIFLASKASDYVTGIPIVIDGGTLATY